MSSAELFEEVWQRYGDVEAFVERVRRALEAHGITQGALARRSGFPPERVSEWIGRSRRKDPLMETMVILDEALEQLIKGE